VYLAETASWTDFFNAEESLTSADVDFGSAIAEGTRLVVVLVVLNVFHEPHIFLIPFGRGIKS